MGFYAYFLMLCIVPLASCECENALNSNVGDIQFPTLNKVDDVCGKYTFSINNPEKNPIILTFTEFLLPKSKDCEKGYAEVIEDSNEAQESPRRFCGNVLPRPMVVVSGIFKLRIILNDNTTKSKLSAEFGECIGCVQKIAKSSGHIQYYLNPEDDTSGTDRLYVVENPNMEPVTLVFDDFLLDGSENCMFEYLQIRDGTTFNSHVVATLCGKDQPNQITIKSGRFTLVFHSEVPYAKHGFSLTFSNSSTRILEALTPTTATIEKDENKLQTTEETKTRNVSMNSTSAMIGNSTNNTTMHLGNFLGALPRADEAKQKNVDGDDSLSKTAITIISTVASSTLLTFSVVFIIVWTRRQNRRTRRGGRVSGYGTYRHSNSLRGPYDLKKSNQNEVNVIYNANFSDPNPIPKVNTAPCVITDIENVDSDTPSVFTSVDQKKANHHANVTEAIENAGKDFAIEDGLQYSFMLISNTPSRDENKNSIKGVYLDNISDNKGLYQAVGRK